MSVHPLQALRSTLSAAAAHLRGSDAELPVDPRLERPKRAGLGDLSTNAAMLLAPGLDAPPRVIAERLAQELASRMGDDLASWDVAGPGFLNLVLADVWMRDALAGVLAAGSDFGAGGADPAQRILVEFVSANPTGPLVAASGRHAAYGDALARILQHHGHTVWREYYFNDAGNQIRLLGESVRARARGEEIPPQGYQGDYVNTLAAQISDAGTRDTAEVAGAAVEILLAQIQVTLQRYGVRYDRFFSERALHDGGSDSAVAKALERLDAAGHVYRSEGASWLRTSAFGDDKDRVVLRSDGSPTYLAADIAYLQDKRERGFERQLLPVGSDHHAYVRELKAAMAALGADPDTLEVPILQFVHLVEGSERAAFSKRRGAFVTLDELLDEIGVDATRFFMLQRSHDRTLDLDLDLARSQSAENPVYYVQYAHARIASVLTRVGEERVRLATAPGAGWDDSGAASELHPSERRLILKLLALPDEVAEAAARRAPHRITAYALELAQEFTAFYRDCRVVGVTPESRESFRIALMLAAGRTIALTLGLLGVSAPDSM